MSRFIVVTEPGFGGGTLLHLLDARNRDVTVVADADGLSLRGGDIRALAVSGDPSPELRDAAMALAVECHAAEVPVLWVGPGASRLLSAVGPGATTVTGEESTEVVAASPTAASQTIVSVEVTEPGQEDPMMAPTPSGVDWLAQGLDIDVIDHVTVLATAAERPVVAVSGSVYVTSLELMIDDEWIDALVQEDVVTEAARPFLKGHAAALLGRWIDLVVGRTDEEMPWGRRGPQPVPAPGLSLNPA